MSDQPELPFGLDDALDYLSQLQSQVDSLREREIRLLERISRLEEEREAASRRWWWRSRAKRPGRTEATPTDPSVLELPPPIGLIPQPALPDGPISRPTLVVATILDQFSRTCFHYEFNCVDITPSNWERRLLESPPHLLLVESAFSGPGRTWTGHIARFGSPSDSLVALVDWCRRRDIPTVFWNKEDPINTGWFLQSARLFDWVFTVDADMVDRYRRYLGHDRVDVLPFAAQPVIHHPPHNEGERVGRVAFPGSYYAGKHPERRAQMEVILDPARDFGLHIFDRFGGSDPRFAWPERYRPHLAGRLTYPQVIEVYRRYRVILNVNTVTGSPTMCSRRVFEALACGAVVISTPSAALDEWEMQGAVLVTRRPDETRRLLSEVLEGGLQPTPSSVPTYGERVERVLAAVGIS
jgi:hypothetical protein